MLRVWHELDLSPRLSPFAYQLNAVAAVKNLPFAGLFHEQGLGKTKIALDLALYWLQENIVDSVLVITKKGLVRNWKEEIETHTSLFCALIDGNKVRTSKNLNRPYRLYLTHYEAVISCQSILSLFFQSRKVGAILDEAHHMKNPAGQVAKSLFVLAPLFARRVVMTGTPVANRPYDIWSPIYFLDQGQSLGTNFKSFKSDYDLPVGAGNDDSNKHGDEVYERSLEKIFLKIKGFVVRETKESSGIELPDKKISDITINMEEQQQMLYDKVKQKIRIEILKNGNVQFDDVQNVLKKMLRLIQIASNPLLVDESYKNKPCKLEALEKIINTMPNGQKAIIWTNFIHNADWLAKQFADYGTTKIHGKLDMHARHRAVQTFKNDKKIKLLIATPGAAKEGLTITVANLAIFYDRNFSLNDWLQAQDRIHRISQKRACEIIHLQAADSIDQWIDRLLTYKNRCAMLAQGDLRVAEKDHYRDEVINLIEGVLS